MEEKPPTPGLKYRHYSPNAYVVLFDITPKSTERQSEPAKPIAEELVNRVRLALEEKQSVGIIHTHRELVLPEDLASLALDVKAKVKGNGKVKEADAHSCRLLVYPVGVDVDKKDEAGRERFSAEVARGLFKALRSLDSCGVDVIFVEVRTWYQLLGHTCGSHGCDHRVSRKAMLVMR